MSTTSLKIPDDLKQLAADAARRDGVSTHAFMVEAIRTAVLAADLRAAFVADAVAAWTDAIETGQGMAASAVHDYLRGRVRGQNRVRPEAVRWRD